MAHQKTNHESFNQWIICEEAAAEMAWHRCWSQWEALLGLFIKKNILEETQDRFHGNVKATFLPHCISSTAELCQW